tara:strand:+ start:1234 stop:1428 length:195 start_codon:yes stop_codon:yes gene_type:complete
MENKTGRKYDRKRWGWKNENDIKHPYYDSDKKLKTEEVFCTFLMYAGIIMVGMAVVGLIIKFVI